MAADWTDMLNGVSARLGLSTVDSCEMRHLRMRGLVMPKEIPECPSLPAPARQPEHSYEIELITPMVGGGAVPGEVDAQFPIRPTAIRGHLRHWWRLIRGYSLGTGMWQREEEIFGSTEFASPVTISVVPLTEPELFDPADRHNVDRFGPVAYALFTSIENQHDVAREGIRFRLIIRTANEAELLRRRTAQNECRKKARQPLLASSIAPIACDVDEAVAAWLTFGGIGGRTRRGCGAIHCLTPFGQAPHLPSHIFVGSAQPTALDAWREALSAYRDFRQNPRGKLHPKTLRNGKTIRVPGRSHWPEADSIRQVTGCSLKPPHGSPPSGVPADEDTHDHSNPVVPVQTLPSFPKAVLGLPINFHFADGPGKNRPGTAEKDPQDVQLVPVLQDASGVQQKADRLSSPVITRPLCIDGNWHPAVIILNQQLPNGLQVRLEGRQAQAGGGDVSHDLQLSHVIDPKLGALHPMRGKSSALEALAEFLTKEKDFTEVTR